MKLEDDPQLFGQLVVRNKLATPEQVEECIGIQRKLEEKGQLDRLGDIMVSKGYLTDNQLRLVLQAQQRISPITGQRIPGYEILARLGQGTLGTVYKARQISMDRVVAIKVLAQHYSRNEEFVQQFIQQARAAAQFSHPNIVRAIDVGNIRNLYYFVMEFVDGISAEERLRKEGLLPEREALEMAAQVCRALHQAHSQGIIHRNIRPSNILVNSSGLAKLSDLGLGMVQSNSSSPASTEIGSGTSGYISIEQARGQVVLDARSDIYSLGATLYHLVTGHHPFETAPGQSKKAVQTAEPLVPPEERHPKVQRSTSAVIQRMMARDPDHRHASVKEVEEDLQCILQNKAPVHTPVPFRPPASSPARGNTDRKVVRGESGGSTILFVPKRESRPETAAAPKTQKTPLPAGLTFITGNDKPRKVQLAQPVTVVGRLPECDIQVAESWFSRKHFVIYARDGRFEIEDLHSTNGTKVNGKEISKSMLQFGDQITVYSTLILFERMSGQQGVEPPA
ncbi:MAG: protein kinase [Planctomycetes bacterium]|nr:protein kinase [Planctomycetota bacterium]